VVFVRRDAADSYLTVGSGEEAIDLAAVPGPAHLEVAGDRVAIRAVALAGPSDGVEVMARQTPRLPPDSLVVIDIEDGSAEIVADTGVVAFFWDADGRQLLYLESEGGARLSWHVWEGGSVRDLSSFSPDPVWVTTFLAFFDQYAQSMTLWAPDGSAFAFPGDIDGEAGVWVQHLDGSPPRLVASGSWVAWSPGG
jgi:hypothetical protein